MYSDSTCKLLDHPAAMLGMLRRAAFAAGESIMDYYDPSGFHGDVELKDDGSPVTPADHAADQIIRAFLADHFPGIPVLTEETAHEVDRASLSAADHYWLVDGLDGTRAFREGDPDFTVNIGLIHKGAPLLGVVYAPAHGEGFMGAAGPWNLARRWRDETDAEEEIRVRPVPRQGLTFLTSRTEQLSPYAQGLMDHVKVNRHIKRASSIKYTDVAAGRADLLVTTRAMNYWDTAAGDAIVRAAGGAVVHPGGAALTYDPARAQLVNRGVVACADLSYIEPVMKDLEALTHA